MTRSHSIHAGIGKRQAQQAKPRRLSRQERQAAEFVAVMADVVVDRHLPYRTALAYWPDEWRERWGHRANELEAQGLPWREAELRAFIEVLYQRRIAARCPSESVRRGANGLP